MISLEGELLGVRQLEQSGGVGIFFELKGGAHAVVTVPEMKEPLVAGTTKGGTTKQPIAKENSTMHQLITTDSNATMTSLEISELVESRHDNVRISIERLAKSGVIQLPPMQEVKDNQSLSPNNKTKVYLFTGEQGKRDSIIVVAQLSPEFTARLVDRWQALEKAMQQPQIDLPADPIMAQLAVLQSVREKQLALESKQQVLAVGFAETRHEVATLKQNMRVENWQQCNLKKAVDHKIAEFRELYPSINTSDAYRKVWRYFKNKFQIPRYQELPAMMYEEGLKTIHSMAMHNLAGL